MRLTASSAIGELGAASTWPRVGPLLPDKPLISACARSRASSEPQLGSFCQIWIKFRFTQTNAYIL